MPVNVVLGRHMWEAEVVWERRRFWMDASKAAARKCADMAEATEAVEAEVEELLGDDMADGRDVDRSAWEHRYNNI